MQGQDIVMDVLYTRRRYRYIICLQVRFSLSVSYSPWSQHTCRYMKLSNSWVFSFNHQVRNELNQNSSCKHFCTRYAYENFREVKNMVHYLSTIKDVGSRSKHGGNTARVTELHKAKAPRLSSLLVFHDNTVDHLPISTEVFKHRCCKK